MTGLLVLVAFGVVLLWAVVVFNGLVRLRNTSDNAWSDIDVYLKKRHDLVPNLVETVKGYARHEKETLERVVEARNEAAAASTTSDRISAENALTRNLTRLMVLAEAYPDLKANRGFLALQSDLTSIENDVANARRYYNAVVRDFNTRQQLFPASLIAGPLGFRERPFFEAGADERQATRVQL
jgi:LemA protein